jgi:hypothetical protein
MPIEVVTVTAAGSAGAAAGTGDTRPLDALITGIKVAYTGDTDTMDVTIAEVGGLNETLLTLTDSDTTGIFNPQDEVDDATGSGLGVFTPHHVPGVPLRVSVAQADAGDIVTVFIKYIKA